MVRFFVLLSIFLGLSFVLDMVWQKIFTGRKYRIFLTPGIIVHEFSHALACLLTGAKIRKISLFRSDGGYVVHEKPKIPILGEVLISLAPIFGGLAMIFFLSFLFKLFLPSETGGFIKWLSINWLDWQFWVFTYLNLSIIVCLNPSFQDLKNAFAAFLVILGAVWLLGITQEIQGLLSHYFEGPLGLSVSFEVFLLVLSLPFYLLKSIVKR